MLCVQLRICKTTEARGVALAKHINVLRSFTCKYCLFSQHLINVAGGLLMCKWVKALLPLCQHNVCTEAQSCLRRRDSQISRCGAKPVALSTREPLRVFNSLSSPLPPLSVCSDETCVHVRLHVCARESITCPRVSMFTHLYHSAISSPSASPASEWQWLRK